MTHGLRSIALTVDACGHTLGHVFIEPLCKTVNCQEIYLRDPATVYDVGQCLRLFLEKYSHQRPNQSLDNLTPAQVYEWARR